MHPIITLLLFLYPLFSLAHPPHRIPSTQLSHLPTPNTPQPPYKFFEVKPPPPHPPTPPCTHLILSHTFAYTYNHPPVTVPFSPPPHCLTPSPSTIILSFSATSVGRQFDRIFGVWVNGVELLRSCTAEPTKNGIYWNVKKDVSRYYSILTAATKNSSLSVYLGNLVDQTYTGVYHVNISLYYYPPKEQRQQQPSVNPRLMGVLGGQDVYYPPKGDNLERNDLLLSKYGNDYADLILPISRNLPLNDGLWFEVENSTQVLSKQIRVPKNVYRAVLEVYVSFHENDEFWCSNLPNEYLVANNLTGSLPGNGPFREVVVSLDGEVVVGAVWPFTVIFTGGVNPLLWRPISAIGSFDLPSYDIEVTPFLGRLLDGKKHSVGFSVTNALNVWFVDANLHLWLDKKRVKTKGGLLASVVQPMALVSSLDFKGLDGRFFTGAGRVVSAVGWVESSFGNVTTTFVQSFDYENVMVLENSANMQTVNQTINFNSTVSASLPSSTSFYKSESYKSFPLYLYTNQVDQGNDSYTLVTNVSMGFDEDKTLTVEAECLSSTLRNEQSAEGEMVVKNNLVVSGLGSTHQIYKYDESNDKFCYYRNVSSFNYTIVSDEIIRKCKSVYSLANYGILLE